MPHVVVPMRCIPIAPGPLDAYRLRKNLSRIHTAPYHSAVEIVDKQKTMIGSQSLVQTAFLLNGESLRHVGLAKVPYVVLNSVGGVLLE